MPVRTVLLIVFSLVLGGVIGRYVVGTVYKPPVVPDIPCKPLNANDSPIHVAGGSISFHSNAGWTGLTSNCVSAGLDSCTYVNVPPSSPAQFNPVRIAFAGLRPGSPANPNNLPADRWKITIYKSQSAAYAPDERAAVDMWSSDKNGNPDSPAAGHYVTMKPHAGQGFWPGGGVEHFFHHPDCSLHPGPHCEEMSRVEVAINGAQPTSYPCLQSVGCAVFIGQ